MDDDTNKNEPEMNADDRAVVPVHRPARETAPAGVSARKLFMPMLVALVVGLAVGFSIGYGYGINQETQGPRVAADAPATDATGDVETADAGQPVQPVETAAPAIEPPSENWPARHMIIAVGGEELAESESEFIASMKPGAVVLAQQNLATPEQTAALIKAIKSAAGSGDGPDALPLVAVSMSDIADLSPEFPGITALGEARDAAQVRAAAKRLAEALKALGVGIVLGPPLAVAPEDDTQIETANFGSDNAVVTALGLAFADSLMHGGILSVATTFPALAPSAEDGVPVVDADIPVLARQMFPFSEAMSRGIPGILAEHVGVSAFEPGGAPRPASISPPLLNELARKQWQYEGVIVSADVSAPVLEGAYTPAATAIAALAAGADAFIVGEASPELFNEIATRIEDAIESGTLDKQRLMTSRERLDDWTAWLRDPEGLEGPLPRVPKPAVEEQPAEQVADAGEAASAEETPDEPVAPAGEKIVHRIERGETLSSIARKYNVSPQDVMAWNDLEDANIKFGFNLDIYPGGMAPEPAPAEASAPTPEEPAAVEAPADEATADVEEAATPEAEVPAEETAEAPEPSGPAPQPENTRRIEHEVMPGEVLSRIAGHYGVPMRDIMEWTGFSDPNIRIGQTLIIYVPEDAEIAPPADEAEVTEPAAAETPAPDTDEAEGSESEPAQETESTEVTPDPAETAEPEATTPEPEAAPQEETDITALEESLLQNEAGAAGESTEGAETP